jgi:hypothetical protein
VLTLGFSSRKSTLPNISFAGNCIPLDGSIPFKSNLPLRGIDLAETLGESPQPSRAAFEESAFNLNILGILIETLAGKVLVVEAEEIEFCLSSTLVLPVIGDDTDSDLSPPAILSKAQLPHEEEGSDEICLGSDPVGLISNLPVY